jgi:hypothetical protein
MTKKYIANGFVLGKLWGGGFGAYKSREVRAKTKTELLKKALQDLKTGVLDSGMGFEFLKGAILNIKEVESIILKGKKYQRADYIIEFIGNLTEKEQDFLLTCEI